MNRVFIALSFLALCQCVSPSQLLLTNTCDGNDAYELGRQHGTQGLEFPTHEIIDAPIYECVPKTGGETRQKYEIGYNSGLADYCTKENGFNIGRSDLSYTGVCPTLSERDFLLGYDMGKTVRQTQLENQKLESRISLLEESKKTLSPHSRQSQELAQQITELKSRLGQNQEKIKQQSL